MTAKSPSLIKIHAPIEAVPFPRPNSNGKRRFNPKRYTEFKLELGTYARLAMEGQSPFPGAIKITINIHKKIIPTGRNFGDWDNHAKAISDALQGICYVDDKQIVEGHVYLSKGEPEINIEVEAI